MDELEVLESQFLGMDEPEVFASRRWTSQKCSHLRDGRAKSACISKVDEPEALASQYFRDGRTRSVHIPEMDKLEVLAS